jgi:hypothetical protein
MGVLMGQGEGQRPFTRHGHSWQDNIKMKLTEIRWESVDCIHLGVDRDKRRLLVNTIIKFWIP